MGYGVLSCLLLAVSVIAGRWDYALIICVGFFLGACWCLKRISSGQWVGRF